MGTAAKKNRVPVKVAERAKAAAQAKLPLVKNEKKAKLVAALKRLHPMD